MKTTWVLMLAFTPAVCFADGYGGAEGLNRAGETLHIEAGDEGLTLYVQKSPDDRAWADPSRERYSMNRECPDFDLRHNATGETFTCSPNQDFPLSGATYKVGTSSKWRSCDVAPYFDKGDDTVYVCVRGCGGKRTPKIFHVTPWEC
jgi:hypothetical protein